VLLEARRWHSADYEAVLPGINLESLAAFAPRLLSRGQAEVLLEGNVAVGTALAFAADLETQLQQR
jgi:secreted Zn-dependent insulinase-like peptidase